MKYYPIIPIHFLNDKEFKIKRTLLLAHLGNGVRYMKACKNFKGIKYLDNSYYETKPKCLSVGELIKVGRKLECLAICIPDTKFKDKQQFYREHQDMARKLRRAGFFVMAVVTCMEDPKIELEEFKILNSIPEVDIIAIPYNFKPPLDSKRPEFLDLIEKEVGVNRITKEVHLFGMYSIDNLKREIRPWIDSIDGTMAFKEGYFKQRLPVPHEKEHKRSEIPNYFGVDKLDKEQRDAIKYNLTWLKEECENE